MCIGLYKSPIFAVFVEVGDGVDVELGVGIGTEVDVAVGLGNTVGDTPSDGTAVGLGDTIGVGLGESVGVGLGDTTDVGLGESVGVGLGDTIGVVVLQEIERKQHEYGIPLLVPFKQPLQTAWQLMQLDISRLPLPRLAFAPSVSCS